MVTIDMISYKYLDKYKENKAKYTRNIEVTEPEIKCQKLHHSKDFLFSLCSHMEGYLYYRVVHAFLCIPF